MTSPWVFLLFFVCLFVFFIGFCWFIWFFLYVFAFLSLHWCPWLCQFQHSDRGAGAGWGSTWAVSKTSANCTCHWPKNKKDPHHVSDFKGWVPADRHRTQILWKPNRVEQQTAKSTAFCGEGFDCMGEVSCSQGRKTAIRNQTTQTPDWERWAIVTMPHDSKLKTPIDMMSLLPIKIVSHKKNTAWHLFEPLTSPPPLSLSRICSLFLSLSLSLSVCVSLSVCLYVSLSLSLSVCLSVCLSVLLCLSLEELLDQVISNSSSSHQTNTFCKCNIVTMNITKIMSLKMRIIILVVNVIHVLKKVFFWKPEASCSVVEHQADNGDVSCLLWMHV